MQLGVFLILKDENFNKAGVGGTSPLSSLCSFKKGYRTCSFMHKEKRLLSPPTPYIFLLKIQNECQPYEKMRELRKKGVWRSEQISLWRTNWVSNCRWQHEGSAGFQGGQWRLISLRRTAGSGCWEEELQNSESGKSTANINMKWTKGDAGFT